MTSILIPTPPKLDPDFKGTYELFTSLVAVSGGCSGVNAGFEEPGVEVLTAEALVLEKLGRSVGRAVLVEVVEQALEPDDVTVVLLYLFYRVAGEVQQSVIVKLVEVFRGRSSQSIERLCVFILDLLVRSN
ncbi:hypothetical protein BGAL_0052g00300 [Botrytis galanthina]|uniref:Uncharacterized protein n=1 Tax=Botrytis galanthina TaxID=278940 RepID=A0A4S8R6A2_9HELO|nr:hypothetical protein BGAL_0052g00300 [Botrytis galanthina]